MSITPSESNSSRRSTSRIFGQYIIKNHFQFKFGFIFFGILVAATFVLWFESSFAINHLIDSDLVKDNVLMEQLKLISGTIGTTAIIISAFSFAIAIFLSHFIAGPMYSFEKNFKEIENGNLNIFVRLRKHDQFKDVAESLNRALAGLRNKMKTERDVTELILTKAGKLSESLKKSPNAADAAELEQLISNLKNRTSQIKI